MKPVDPSPGCGLPCTDVNRDPVFPGPELYPESIRLILVSEAPPVEHSHYYYRDPAGSFFRTTQAAFRDAGADVGSWEDITGRGIYLTTAIKCSKQGYGVGGGTVRACSHLLEEEVRRFPRVRAILCMGDLAIKAVNHIAKRSHGRPAVPAGSTYRIRGEEHLLQGIRYFPSYTQTGESYWIEKSKRQMIAEDIRNALRLIGAP